VLGYLVRRSLATLLLLFVISVMVFAIFFLLPRLAGASPETLASRYVGRTADQKTVALVAENMGFNDPLPVQYGRWAKGLLVGSDYNYGAGTEHCPAPCFGYSFVNNRPIFPELMNRAPVTFSLAIGAAVIWTVFGVGAGMISALRRGSLLDRGFMLVALAGVSLPIFWTGAMALSLFSYKWHITPGSGYVPLQDNPVQWAQYLTLPWITLALLFSAQYARLTRAGMLETMNEDYIRTARAKGLPEGRVVVKHGLRGTLTPLLTIFGLDFGLLIGGAVLTETVFSLPGLGKYALEGIFSDDLGVTLFAALFVALANLVVDLLYAVVDPRVRTS
jgi:peptide/nickel transport system permease protein